MKTKILAICILLIGLFAGCKTIKETTKTDSYKGNTEQSTHREKDSIFIYKRDSVFMLVKGDTILIERFSDLYKYKDILRTDTLIKTDSIYINKQVIEKQGLSKMDSFWIVLGRILLIVVALYVIIRVVIWKLKH